MVTVAQLEREALEAAAEHLEALAVRALIEEDPRLVDRVGIGDAPQGTGDQPLAPPYVLLLRAYDDEGSDRLTGPATRRPSFTVQAVSTTSNGADDVLGWVDARLRPGAAKRGAVPVVPGRRCKPIRRLERPGNAEDDTATGAVTWNALAVYAFESYPA